MGFDVAGDFCVSQRRHGADANATPIALKRMGKWHPLRMLR
jgi:hypothetical protein